MTCQLCQFEFFKVIAALCVNTARDVSVFIINAIICNSGLSKLVLIVIIMNIII